MKTENGAVPLFASDRHRKGVRPLFRGSVTLLAVVALSAQTAPQKIVVGSPTLVADQRMPRDYTPDGRNMSPPLTWSQLPAGTKELAVICEDPDAGNPPPFSHWVVYRIPATAKGLPEGLPIDPAAALPAEIAGAIQGVSHTIPTATHRNTVSMNTPSSA